MYDLEFKATDGRNVSKLLYFLYSPDDNSNNTEKFVVAVNKDQLKAKISEINDTHQINRWDDLDEKSLITKYDNWAKKGLWWDPRYYE